MEVEKNECRYPVPSQPVAKHSNIPLGHKRSAREVVVASFLKILFFFLFPILNLYHPKKWSGTLYYKNLLETVFFLERSKVKKVKKVKHNYKYGSIQYE